MEGGHGGVRAVPGPALAREKSKFKLFTLIDKIIIEFLNKEYINEHCQYKCSFRIVVSFEPLTFEEKLKIYEKWCVGIQMLLSCRFWTDIYFIPVNLVM